MYETVLEPNVEELESIDAIVTVYSTGERTLVNLETSVLKGPFS